MPGSDTVRHQMDISNTRGAYGERWIGVIGSLALHILGAVVLLTSRSTPLPPDDQVIDVSIETLLNTQPRRQIVSPSVSTPAPPPQETTKLSDEDSLAPKEQIKRGDNGGIPNPTSQAQEAARSQQTHQPKAAPTERRSEPPKPEKETAAVKPRAPHTALKELRLDDSTLTERFAKPSNRKPEEQITSPSNQANYKAFSRPQGSGATFVGAAGVTDHLPNLPDGDITLLNAKANTFAGFVRRVAVQVFTQLRTQGWETLNIREVQQISGFATVEAVLSPDGKFMRCRILESSGNPSFDSVVDQSVKAGARDPNPPEGARADDGLIHFIFKAKSWASIGMNNRNGAPVERRWLLLSTGLE